MSVERPGKGEGAEGPIWPATCRETVADTFSGLTSGGEMGHLPFHMGGVYRGVRWGEVSDSGLRFFALDQQLCCRRAANSPSCRRVTCSRRGGNNVVSAWT